MTNKIFRMVVIVLMLMASTMALAKSSPVTMLEQVSSQMISELQAQELTIKDSPKVVYQLVEKILLPHVDMYTMSRLVLGRSMWHKATDAQRKEFQHQFTIMLIRTYASALAEYTDEKIEFSPLRSGDVDKPRVMVKSQIKRATGPDISLHYRLLTVYDEVTKKHKWLVYDLNVEGVSLVDSMRSQMNGKIHQQGLAGLLTDMAEHNKDYQ